VHDTNSWFDLFGLAITPTKTYGRSGELLSGTATVTVADLGTGTATNASSRIWARQNGLSTDDAGHIIGKQLGGSGGIENVFPQDCHVNRGIFAQFEGDVGDFIRTHGSGKITVEFEYDLNVSSTRPTNVHYTVESPGGQKLHQNFLNSH
jgi:hypothetical protein